MACRPCRRAVASSSGRARRLAPPRPWRAAHSRRSPVGGRGPAADPAASAKSPPGRGGAGCAPGATGGCDRGTVDGDVDREVQRVPPAGDGALGTRRRLDAAAALAGVLLLLDRDDA